MSAIVRGFTHRRPFHVDRVPELIAFATRHPVAYLDAASFEHGLQTTIGGPASVVDVFAGDQRIALAVVYDHLDEPPDSVLAALVAASDLLHDWSTVCEIVLDAAADLARAAHRPTVTVSWREPLPAEVAAAFAARSHRPLLQECRMERPPGPAAMPLPPLPRGWRWHDVGAERVPTSLALLREAFAGIPSFLPGENELARFLVGDQQRSRLLCQGESPAGFARVTFDPAQRLGYIGPIARHPSHRGQRLGDLLVAECLNLLDDLRPARICLDVIASNAPAIELYLRHGFRMERRLGYYQGPVAATL
jgi:ribosomal protein S18 acetylase RimI-like enzyme